MASFELILLILALSAGLQIPARRLGVPHPVLLVIGGAILAVLPGLPRVTPDPELAFVVFVPPLLYWTAVSSSFRDFRAELWPIVRLGVLLVLVTMVAVAWTAHALTPEFTWPAAFVLAAIVAPPDPVSATAVMRTVDAPSALVSILEGEGLVNDATALVAYRVAVAAAVTGTFSPTRAGVGLLLTGSGGVLLGYVAARAIAWLRRRIRGMPIVENTVSVLTPFVVYIAADRAGVSGVLAVVVVGLYLGRVGPHVVTAATRVQAEAMWSMLTTWLEGLVFILIGLELPYAYRALHAHSLATLLAYGAAVSAVAVVVRMLWVFPSAYLPRLLSRRARPDGVPARPLPSWRWVVTVGWAGVRGGDSLVIALALPLTTRTGAAFPARDLIVFVTFSVIFATLIVQGLTIRPLLRLLGVHAGDEAEAEETRARRVAAEAGLRRLDHDSARDGVGAESARQLREHQARRLRYWSSRESGETAAGKAGVSAETAQREAEGIRRLKQGVLDAERAALLELRDRGEIGDDVMRRVQRDLDLETMILEAADEDAPESPYDLDVGEAVEPDEA